MSKFIKMFAKQFLLLAAQCNPLSGSLIQAKRVQVNGSGAVRCKRLNSNSMPTK